MQSCIKAERKENHTYIDRYENIKVLTLKPTGR